MNSKLKKKFSIIIPHYNSPNSLEMLLKSIPMNDELEVIVVDDRSTEEIEGYNNVKNNYMDVIFLENNKNKKGAGVARNVGLERASGDWLIFADADDFFTHDFWGAVNKYYETQYDIVYFTPTSMDINCGKIAHRHEAYVNMINNYMEIQSVKEENILRYMFAPPWSKMIRRELVISNKIVFSETKVSNDVLFSMLCGYYAKGIGMSKEIIYCVTISEGSLTTSISKDVWQTRMDIDIERHNFLKQTLSKTDFEDLNIEGKVYLYLSVYYKFGWKCFWSVFRKLRKNKFKLWYLKNINPSEMFRQIKAAKEIKVRNKKYMKKSI